MQISRRAFLVAGAWMGLAAFAKAEERSHDVVVVGGSFAGLSAALQLVRAQRRVLVIDAGKPRNRFARAMHGVLGQDGRTPQDFIAEATRQLLAYPTVTIVSGLASAAKKEGLGFTVSTLDGRAYRASRLILATGVKDELPDLDGLSSRWGVTVLHCPYCHGYEVKGQSLGVLASHALSVRQAALIPDWGPTTYFTQGICEPDQRVAAHLAARGVVIERTPIVRLLGTAPGLEGVKLRDGRVIPLAALFVVPKTTMASPLAEELGCEIEAGAVSPLLRTDAMKQTTVPGVYAAGDVVNFMQKVAPAVSSGVLAGIGAHQSLLGG